MRLLVCKGGLSATIAIRALIVGGIGAIALALVAFFMGANLGYIFIAALAGFFLGAMFGL